MNKIIGYASIVGVDDIIISLTNYKTYQSFYFENFDKNTSPTNLCENEYFTFSQFPASMNRETLLDCRRLILNRYYAYFCELALHVVSANQKIYKVQMFFDTKNGRFIDVENDNSFSEDPPFAPNSIWERMFNGYAWIYVDLIGCNPILIVNPACSIAVNQLPIDAGHHRKTIESFITECNYKGNNRFINCYPYHLGDEINDN